MYFEVGMKVPTFTPAARALDRATGQALFG